MADIITLNQEALDRLQKIIYGEAALKEAEKVKGNYEMVKKESIKFINSLNNLKDSTSISISVSDFKISNYKTAKERTRQSLRNDKVVQAILDFEKAFNNFMGRTITLTMVDDEGQVFFYDDKAQSDIYLKSGGKSTSRISLAFGKANEEKNVKVLQEIFDQVFETSEEKKHIKRVEEVYRTAISRYDETHVKGSSGTENNFIYWHDPGTTRKYAFVKSKGLLGEGYVKALFSIDNNISEDERFGEELDKYNLENYYYNYVLAADNRSGSVIGDIADSILDSMQLAVKNKKGYSQTFANLVTIAQHIIENEVSIESMKEWIEKQEKGRSKEFQNSPLIKKINKRLTENVKNSVEGEGYIITYVTKR